MPECPEIHFASQFINSVCASQIFRGKVEKSAVSKNADVKWNCKAYKILSKSRGKELMLTLTDISKGNVDDDDKTTAGMNILVHFGMSGIFKMTPRKDLPKHAHLMFHTTIEKEPMTLSFVDTRRFGTWKVSSAWTPDRGPDPVFEYDSFRENVLSNLKETVFNKPICEAMLNQSYFNGIGNYLRAEILYRAKLMPFSKAREVLENLHTEVKQEHSDLLQLCHDVPLEVLNLGGSNVTVYDPDASKEDAQPFFSWLQCYNCASMNKMQDHNKRAIWFSGKPGPLAPKNSRIKKPRKTNPKTEETQEKDLQTVASPTEKPIPRKRKIKKREIKEDQIDTAKELPRTRSRTKITPK